MPTTIVQVNSEQSKFYTV